MVNNCDVGDPQHASWEFRCGFSSQTEVNKLAARYGLSALNPRLPTENERPDGGQEGEVAVFKFMLQLGIELPFPEIIKDFLDTNRLSPFQLLPNGWRVLYSFISLCKEKEVEYSQRLLSLCYNLKPANNEVALYTLSAKRRRSNQRSSLILVPRKFPNWASWWFFVRLEGVQFGHTGKAPRVPVITTDAERQAMARLYECSPHSWKRLLKRDKLLAAGLVTRQRQGQSPRDDQDFIPPEISVPQSPQSIRPSLDFLVPLSSSPSRSSPLPSPASSSSATARDRKRKRKLTSPCSNLRKKIIKRPRPLPRSTSTRNANGRSLPHAEPRVSSPSPSAEQINNHCTPSVDRAPLTPSPPVPVVDRSTASARSGSRWKLPSLWSITDDDSISDPDVAFDFLRFSILPKDDKHLHSTPFGQLFQDAWCRSLSLGQILVKLYEHNIELRKKLVETENNHLMHLNLYKQVTKKATENEHYLECERARVSELSKQNEAMKKEIASLLAERDDLIAERADAQIRLQVVEAQLAESESCREEFERMAREALKREEAWVTNQRMRSFTDEAGKQK